MEEVRGVLQIFSISQKRWIVGQLRGEKASKVVGVLPADISEGSSVLMRGKWESHPKYGKGFKFREVELDLPQNEVTIVEYLTGFPKIGRVLARAIYDHFGEDVFNILDTDPKRIAEVPRVSVDLAYSIADTWKDLKETFEYDRFFTQCQLTPGARNKIFTRVAQIEGIKYNPEDGASPDLRRFTKYLIETNPYTLIHLAEGIAFKKADFIARQIGFDIQSPQRIQAALYYVLEEAKNRDGHCCLPPQRHLADAKKLLQIDAQVVEREQATMLAAKTEICYDYHRTVDDPFGYVALVNMLELERKLAQEIRRLVYREHSEANIEFDEKDEWLTDAQKEAIKIGIQSPFFLLTGLPGTGKTTALKTIIDILGEDCKIELAAPTGKAAKRMFQATGKPARTIHRLLEYNWHKNGFQRNSGNPIEADVVIIDETSMIDTYLAYSLFRSIDTYTKIILVGDQFQLPSVGAGRVFNDIIDSKIAPNVHLSQIMRQAKSSYIIRNAHEVHHGRPLIPDPRDSNTEADFFLWSEAERHENSLEIAQDVINAARWFIDKGFGMKDIQVLCPVNVKSPIGSDALNRELREVFNPNGKDILNLDMKIGDRVMQIKNNYRLFITSTKPSWMNSDQCIKNDSIELEISDTESIELTPELLLTNDFIGDEAEDIDVNIPEPGVFNGEIGVLKAFNEKTKEIAVEWDDGRFTVYPITEARAEMKVAFAISVHKSQGSEFPVVIFPCHKSNFIMLQRNLLYTAITRAVKYMCFIAQRGASEMAIDRNEAQQRLTNLMILLHEDL